MTANHTGRRAGHIQQYSIEGRPVPPVSGLTDISSYGPRHQPQPLQVAVEPAHALLVTVDSHQLGQIFAELQHVACLASGRGTSIEYPHPAFGLEKQWRQLCSGVLNRDRAIREVRKLGDIYRLFQPNGLRSRGVCARLRSVHRGEPLCVVSRGTPPGIDAQPHGWRVIVGPGDGLPVIRPVRHQAFE